MAFARAAKTNEITPGTIREFQIEGKAIALANVGGKFYAINYDVTTGKVGQNPTVGVDCYAVEVRGEDIFVDAR